MGDDDLVLPPELEGAGGGVGGGDDEGYIAVPMKGVSPPQGWVNSSQLAIDHVMAGSFETAFALLHEQVGVTEFAAFKPLMLTAYSRCRVGHSPLPSVPTLYAYPQRSGKEAAVGGGTAKGGGGGGPVPCYRLSQLVSRLQQCYQLTTGGKFAEAAERFRSLLLCIPLLAVDTRQQVSEATQLLRICTEYIVGLQMEMARKDLPKTTLEEQKRVCELAAYFTHCSLQPVHQILTLRTAVNLFFKLNNYKMAAAFVRRLLELGPRPEVAAQTRKMLQACDKNLVDEHVVAYDEHNPFRICARTYVPIYRGRPEAKCPLCEASYIGSLKGELCCVCTVARVDSPATGLRISLLPSR